MFTNLRHKIQTYYDAYRVLRVMHYLRDLDKLLDECETHEYDAKRRGKLKRYCRLLWHQDVFGQAIEMMKHNLDGREAYETGERKPH